MHASTLLEWRRRRRRRPRRRRRVAIDQIKTWSLPNTPMFDNCRTTESLNRKLFGSTLCRNKFIELVSVILNMMLRVLMRSAGACIGVVFVVLLSCAPSALVCARASTSCTTAQDCSLGGACVEGKCSCYSTWTGENCSVLNLGAGTNIKAFNRPDNESSWGGSVIRGADGMYHMFAADMTHHCGLNSWESNSAIRHLVSETPGTV